MVSLVLSSLFIIICIDINLGDAYDPREWITNWYLNKQYLYHDQCFPVTKKSVMDLCNNTYNGTIVASIPSSYALNWIQQSLITSYPQNTDSITKCTEYTISGKMDRFILFGAEKVASNDYIWWNLDEYNASLLSPQLSNGYPLEPALLMAFNDNTFYDDNWSRNFSVICERSIPEKEIKWTDTYLIYLNSNNTAIKNKSSILKHITTMCISNVYGENYHVTTDAIDDNDGGMTLKVNVKGALEPDHVDISIIGNAIDNVLQQHEYADVTGLSCTVFSL